MRRVEVLADGNCQFGAVIRSGRLDFSIVQLRSEVVKYLAPLVKLFQEPVEERFQGKWSLCLKYIEEDGSWGDPLTLLGLPHILRRPIRVVTDSHSQDAAEHTRVIEPLEMIPETWGEALVITCRMEKHVDAVDAAWWVFEKALEGAGD